MRRHTKVYSSHGRARKNGLLDSRRTILKIMTWTCTVSQLLAHICWHSIAIYNQMHVEKRLRKISITCAQCFYVFRRQRQLQWRRLTVRFLLLFRSFSEVCTFFEILHFWSCVYWIRKGQNFYLRFTITDG